MIKRLYFIVTILILTGCETYVEVDLPTETPQITLNTVLNPDSTVRVSLTKSRASGTRGTVYDNITNAEVSFYKNDQKLAQLSHAGNGNYLLSGLKPAAEPAQYSVKANVPGFTSVEASEMMVKKPDIRSITTTPYLDNNFLYKDFNIAFTLDDAPEDNFYLVRAYLVSASNQALIYSQLTNNLGQFPPVDRREISLFSDKLFSGKSVQLNLGISNLLVPQGAHSILVEIANISRSFYDYEFTVKKQLANDPLFGQEYLPVTNNIKNGLGIFGTQNTTSFSFVVKK